MKNTQVDESKTTEQESTDSVQPEQFVSKSQAVADSLENDKVVDKPLDTEGDEDSIDPGESSEADDISDEDIDSIIDEIDNDTSEPEEESDKSTNVQKRIDELTAAKKTAEEKLEQAMKLIETPKPEKEVKKDDRISDKELTVAIKDFIEEGDADGIMQVINYKLKLQDEDLTTKYRKEQQEVTSQVARKQQEWASVIKDFSSEAYEQEALQSNPDFNIQDKNSKLYKLADELFTKNKSEYSVEGGMRKAVEKAFQKLVLGLLSSKKKAKTSSKEVEGLQNRLSKEQRKNTVGEGASSITDAKIPGSTKKKSNLEEVLSERSKFKNERIGM